jgi:hypothetical protein
MYKVEIDISAWGGDEKVVVETTDFDKVQIIQEFIELQIEHGWAADYAVVELDDEEDEEFEDEIGFVEEEDEPVTVSTYVITKIEE